MASRFSRTSNPTIRVASGFSRTTKNPRQVTCCGRLRHDAARFAHQTVELVFDEHTEAAMDFPVWSKGVSAQGTVKATPGWVNVPMVCAGASVRPGDVIVGDADGVVIVPRETAADVARLAQERVAKEEKTRERLRNGELGLDFYGLRSKLTELGVKWVDEI